MRMIGMISTLLALVTTASYGLEFYPQSMGGPTDPLNAISLTGTKVVTIYIKNTDNREGSKYKLIVDGKEVGLTGNIAWKKRESFDIPVKINKAGVPEMHKVCAATMGGSLSIMQCTYAQLLWIAHE